MPSATIKPEKGIKRKAEGGKDSYVKKAKVDGKSIKKEKKVHVKAPKVKKPVVVAEPEEEDDEEEDSFGGLSENGGADLEGEDDDEDMNAPDEDDDTPQGMHPDRAKATTNGAGPNGTNSREAHAKQKQLVLERKNAKPLADQLTRTKKLWEKLRRKSHVPLEERKLLVAELFEIITGKMKDFVLKHDSVRVVQTAIKYANVEQKRQIAKELHGTYRQLAESRYAKFLIGKLLVQDDDEIRDIIIPEFYGHVRRLIKHPEAAWILDDVYRGVATKQQRAIILREWYGAEFAVFKTEGKVSGDLKDILEAEPGKRAPIMRSLQELINHLIQKKLTGFTLLHDAMLQYFLNAKPGTEEITDFIELLLGDEEGDLLKNLAFTRSGSRVVSLALAYGSAKTRKQILKTYKDTLQMMAGDPNGHIIILTAYEVIDDTVLTSKSIFPELFSKDAEKQVENVVFSAEDLNARTTLLYLFQGRSGRLFPPSLDVDLEILKEVDTIRTTTSKKDPAIRQAELRKAISPFLLSAIAAVPAQLASTNFGCQLIAEVLFDAEGDKGAALEAIASIAAGAPIATEEPANQEEGDDIEEINTHSTPSLPHISQTSHGGKMLKILIQGGRYNPKTKSIAPVVPALNFGNLLFPTIKDHLVEWATGPSSFIVLSLLECDDGVFDKKTDVLKILKKQRKALEKAATEETVEQRKIREEKEAEADDAGGVKSKSKPKSKAKVVKPKAVGNVGSRLILEFLK